MERAESSESSGEESDFRSEATNDPIDPADRRRIEEFFDRAAADRAQAFNLKRELDRLGVFKEYEDRFLDLFKKDA